MMPRARPAERASTIDVQAEEAVAGFVRVLNRYGCTPGDIGREVLKACRDLPKPSAQSAKVGIREMDAAAHIVTVWFSEPAFLDRKGNPCPLPLVGARSSLESLAIQVDPTVDPKAVLRYLLDTRSLRRVGTRYVPRERLISVRGYRGYHLRSLRGLLAMLWTLEHNLAPQRSTPGWFEVHSINPRFPVKERAAFDRRLRRLGMRFLVQIDADMHRCERRRKKGERTVPLGVAIYRFEGRPPKRLERLGRRRRRTRK